MSEAMGAVAGSFQGVQPESLGAAFGVEKEKSPPTGWFSRLVVLYLRHRRSKPRTATNGNAVDLAHRAIKVACAQSAVTGASAGLVSTGATVVTAQTEGVAGLIAIPIAAAAIGSEMALRTVIHLDLICTMADIFEIEFDPEEPEDIFRLCALAFGAADHDDESSDPGKALVHELAHMETDEVGEDIGHKILGESVMRNVIPVFGVVGSAYTNWKKTQQIGDSARRFMRYQRAFRDALRRVSKTCESHFGLLVEGMWFVFIADGRLSPEESACLAKFVKTLPACDKESILARFVEDEYDWLQRVEAEVGHDLRADFMHALEVAAAVDKKVGLPERRLLRSVARRLDLAFDPNRLLAMIKQFEATGMLTNPDVTMP
jgi:hypothetical protein